jgi:putative ABC transport system permease protein
MREHTVARLIWVTALWVGVVALICRIVASAVNAAPLVAAICSDALLAAALAIAIFGVIDYGWQRFLYELPESGRIALAQIRANKMRSALTALGVIIGIVAITLMGTAIFGIDAAVDRSFAGFGDDLLYVTKWPWHDVEDWWVYRNRQEIDVTYSTQINDWIAEHPGSTLKLAVPIAARDTNVLRGEMKVSNIHVMGTEATYARMVHSDMKEGRFFTDVESRGGRNVAVIGFDVADALFPGVSALDQAIQIGNQRYTVIGVAARQGSFLGLFSWDSHVLLPLSAFARSFPLDHSQPEIDVQVDTARIDDAKDELRGLMRRMRRLSPEVRDDFEINSQQVVRDQIEPMKQKVFVGGAVIVALALLVGAIGIMNITYVSVKERTKEIGTRKALGATRRTILLQFLIEAVSIATLGGALGLALAWLMATAAAAAFPQMPVVFSFWLVLIGLSASVITGIFSGFAPAWQASKLDPVVALRYE